MHTQARLWIITIGFTLSFGALFAKTWQAYRIYTTPSLKDKVTHYGYNNSTHNDYQELFKPVK